MSLQQLTPAEVGLIKEMATAQEYRHVPTGTLAILAQRLGKGFASASTWYRLIHVFGWRRPRKRIHPAKPKNGIRATRADEIWHVDTTQIRLLDGSRAYLHALIDNFSRRIVAWKVDERFHPATTAELLLGASRRVIEGRPTLLADGGVENFDRAVDELVDSGVLKRLLARTEIQFSNSLIESWWRVLKHQWESALASSFAPECGTIEGPSHCKQVTARRLASRSSSSGETSRGKVQNVLRDSFPQLIGYDLRPMAPTHAG